jgi:putative transcriptional regulator
MTLGSKIKRARSAKKMTQLQLSEVVGVNRASIAQYETDTFVPPINTLKKIADACDVDMLYFFDDEDASKNQIVKKELKNNFEKYAHLIPAEYSLKNVVFLSKSDMLIGAGSEGAYDLDLFNKETKIAVDRSFIKGLDPKNLKLFEVVGDSMQPEYDEGDLAIVDMVNFRGDFIKIGGIYVVRVGDVVYVKRVEFLPKGAIKLISLNSKYGDLYPHKEGYEYEILGKVCGKIKLEIQKGLTFSDSGIK